MKIIITQSSKNILPLLSNLIVRLFGSSVAESMRESSEFASFKIFESVVIYTPNHDFFKRPELKISLPSCIGTSHRYSSNKSIPMLRETRAT